MMADLQDDELYLPRSKRTCDERLGERVIMTV